MIFSIASAIISAIAFFISGVIWGFPFDIEVSFLVATITDKKQLWNHSESRKAPGKSSLNCHELYQHGRQWAAATPLPSASAFLSSIPRRAKNSEWRFQPFPEN
jgi:hypothetical protein